MTLRDLLNYLQVSACIVCAVELLRLRPCSAFAALGVGWLATKILREA